MQNIELEISKMEKENNNDRKYDEGDDISIIVTKYLEKKQKELLLQENDNNYLGSKSIMSYFDDDSKKRIKEKLAKSIEKDIDEIIYWKYRFIKIGNCFESISQILTLGSTVVAFSAGYTNEKYLSFVAGCLGSISLALLKASVFAFKESKERNLQLNKILETFKFKEIPDFIKEH